MRTFVCDENMCSGCMACKDVCPKKAISIEDSVKYYNAIIDEDKCIECKLCKKVCQQISPPLMRNPIQWVQGWSSNEEIRSTSSSGGLAATIEREFVENGGVVCSCAFSKGEFVFKFARTIEEVKNYRGSKYVKSNPSGVYREIKTLTSKGEKVLFLGLPCQVASLKKYCDSELLYTIDIICHGTPSPYVLQSFLEAYKVDIRTIAEISFRTKNDFGVRGAQKTFSIPGIRDYYTYCFLKSLIYTENCYSCKFAQLSRVSDLTIGDAWGSEMPKEVRKKGVSIALCMTSKGQELLNNDDLNLFPIDLEKAVEANDQLNHPAKLPIDRDKILEGIINGEKYTRIIKRLYPKMYFKNIIKKCLYIVHMYPLGGNR